jgi:hypothetical protein
MVLSAAKSPSGGAVVAGVIVKHSRVVDCAPYVRRWLLGKSFWPVLDDPHGWEIEYLGP